MVENFDEILNPAEKANRIREIIEEYKTKTADGTTLTVEELKIMKSEIDQLTSEITDTQLLDELEPLGPTIKEMYDQIPEEEE